jgi:phosphoribosylformylglycinamidine synthase
MIFFFGNINQTIFAVSTQKKIDALTLEKLSWLFGNLPKIDHKQISGNFVGPRASMVTPWSTNAVEITQNMGISGIERIEQYWPLSPTDKYDPIKTCSFWIFNLKPLKKLQILRPTTSAKDLP